MTRNRLTVQSWGRRSLAHRPGVEPLDVRILPSVVGSPVDPRQNRAIGLTPAVAVRVGAATAAVAQGVVPLSGVPALNSLPGAVAALYLDFDGFFESAWGSYRNISTPAFDQDGDASSFSLGELDTIRRIWSSVAEDFAPFRINVTTVQPLTFANRVAERVAIGGDGAWTGDLYGGISYIDSFTNSIPNTAYVFPRNLGNGDAKYTAEAISHEAGHAFGLQHQSRYDAYGNKIDEYSTGPGDGLAPIMGVSYYATRGLWWYGTSSVSAQAIQDDMALLARSANGFGYRADDHGDTATSATPLVVSGLQLNGAGIITTTADRDVFSFTTNAGTVNVAVDVPAGINNLDARLELRDASGTTLIASAAPSDRFGASISVPVAAGSYRL
ncbi:MAG TPA: pre-peptidase C-terminal domain-containing protein, partial [Isosphaeraceae bacterium]